VVLTKQQRCNGCFENYRGGVFPFADGEAIRKMSAKGVSFEILSDSQTQLF